MLGAQRAPSITLLVSQRKRQAGIGDTRCRRAVGDIGGGKADAADFIDLSCGGFLQQFPLVRS